MFDTAKAALGNIFLFLADLHTETGWDPAVGQMFQDIANELLGQ